jgi:hypothetical protein
MPLLHKLKWNLTWRSAVTWALLFALCAKGVFLYESRHPGREDLLAIEGRVESVHLGGKGSATWLDVSGPQGTRRFGSWFGVDWPGMELLRPGDRVGLLAEHNRLSGTARVETAPYYFWQLIHEGRVIVTYEQVRDLVTETEAEANRWIDLVLWLALASAMIAWSIHWASKRA